MENQNVLRLSRAILARDPKKEAIQLLVLPKDPDLILPQHAIVEIQARISLVQGVKSLPFVFGEDGRGTSRDDSGRNWLVLNLHPIQGTSALWTQLVGTTGPQAQVVSIELRFARGPKNARFIPNPSSPILSAES